MTTRYTDREVDKSLASYKLRYLLHRLGVKSAGKGLLFIEDISTVMKSVTYDASNLVLWPKGGIKVK